MSPLLKKFSTAPKQFDGLSAGLQYNINPDVLNVNVAQEIKVCARLFLEAHADRQPLHSL